MGVVRRHPFLTFVFVVASLPVVFLVAIEAAQHTPACKAWRAEVDSRSAVPAKLSLWDDHHRGEMSVDEYYGRKRAHTRYELRDTRPLLCE